MMNHVEERNSHCKVGIFLPVTSGIEIQHLQELKTVLENWSLKSHRLQTFKVHYLLLCNLCRLLYNVNNNCLSDLKIFSIFGLSFGALVFFFPSKGFQFYEERKENK